MNDKDNKSWEKEIIDMKWDNYLELFTMKKEFYTVVFSLLKEGHANLRDSVNMLKYLKHYQACLRREQAILECLQEVLPHIDEEDLIHLLEEVDAIHEKTFTYYDRILGKWEEGAAGSKLIMYAYPKEKNTLLTNTWMEMFYQKLCVMSFKRDGIQLLSFLHNCTYDEDAIFTYIDGKTQILRTEDLVLSDSIENNLYEEIKMLKSMIEIFPITIYRKVILAFAVYYKADFETSSTLNVKVNRDNVGITYGHNEINITYDHCKDISKCYKKQIRKICHRKDR